MSIERKEFSMSPWLKAGLVGGAVLVVLNLLGIIPCVGLITCILGLIAYVCIGALAANWMPPVRMAGPAAGQGALAAVVAALIGGVVNTIILLGQAAILGSGRILSQIPPDALRQLEQAGMDPKMLDSFAGPTGAILGGSLCCIGGIILAAILGAIGGAVYAAIKAD
jgi:hypothetical protein